MSRWSFPTHNLDIEHRVCGVGWFKKLWIAEFCMTVFIIIVGLVGSMSFELLSFGWLFFNVIVIECMHKEMWNLFHDIQKCAPLTHCGNDIPWNSTIFLCTKILFFSFLQRVKSKVGRKLPPARNSTSVDFKCDGVFICLETLLLQFDVGPWLAFPQQLIACRATCYWRGAIPYIC